MDIGTYREKYIYIKKNTFFGKNSRFWRKQNLSKWSQNIWSVPEPILTEKLQQPFRVFQSTERYVNTKEFLKVKHCFVHQMQTTNPQTKKNCIFCLKNQNLLIQDCLLAFDKQNTYRFCSSDPTTNYHKVYSFCKQCLHKYLVFLKWRSCRHFLLQNVWP